GLGDAQGGGGRREAAQLGDGDQELEGVQVGACDVTAKPRHIRDDMTCSGSGTTARGLGARRWDACLFQLEPVYLPRPRRPAPAVPCPAASARACCCASPSGPSRSPCPTSSRRP